MCLGRNEGREDLAARRQAALTLPCVESSGIVSFGKFPSPRFYASDSFIWLLCCLVDF
jgi:hypothetical protein